MMNLKVLLGLQVVFLGINTDAVNLKLVLLRSDAAAGTDGQDSWCSTSMKEQTVDSCYDLAQKLNLPGHENIYNNENGQQCASSNPQPGDEMFYPCTPADKQTQLANFQQQGSICSTTMAGQKVQSCWDLAMSVGLDGADNNLITNYEKHEPCGQSNPAPTDAMVFPCSPAAYEKQQVILKKMGAQPVIATGGAPTTLARTESMGSMGSSSFGATCQNTMAESGVSSCWDFAVAVGLDGNDHTKIINLDKGSPCAQSNPQPSDVMQFPCKNGASAPMGGMVAAQAPTFGSAPSTNFAAKAGECSGTLIDAHVDNCWDFAVAMGMDGADHVKITNVAKSSLPCSKSNPQPNDLMSYPCPTASVGSSLLASTDYVNSGASSIATVGDSCMTTMVSQGVSNCWDLAVNLGFKGEEHTKIFNSARNAPCAQSNPQLTDTMTYPCFQTAMLSLSEKQTEKIDAVPQAAGFSFLEKTEHFHKNTHKAATSVSTNATKKYEHPGHGLMDTLKREVKRFLGDHEDSVVGEQSLLQLGAKKTAMETWREQIATQEKLNQQQMIKNAQHQNQQQQAQTEAAAALEMQQSKQANYAANLQNNNGAVLEGLGAMSWGQQSAGVTLHKKHHHKKNNDVLIPIHQDKALLEEDERLKSELESTHQSENSIQQAIIKAGKKGQLNGETSDSLIESIGHAYGKSYTELLQDEQDVQKQQVLNAEEQVAAQASALREQAREQEEKALAMQKEQQDAVARATISNMYQASE